MLVLQDISFMGAGEWDEFVTGHPSGTLFHTSAWLDILVETQSLLLQRIGYFEDGILVGVLPIFIKNIWPLRVAASPFVVEDTPYMGVVIDSDRLPRALELLGPYMKRRGIHFLRILQRDDLLREMRPPGFQVTEKHTHLVDLTKSEDALWNAFEGRCRTAVRKGEKGGVTIREESCRQGLDAYYTILDNLYAGQNMATPNPKNFYTLLWDAFAGGQFHMLTAWLDETLIAGALIIHDRDRCYYLNGASRSDYNTLCPNNLLQWEALRLAKSLGALRYDFVGSDIERLAKFKKSFGGELMTYVCLERSSSAWVSFIRQKYPEFKMIAGRIRNRLRRKS